MYAPAPAQAPAPTLRRRHRGRTVLIVVLVLAGLVVVADRVALVVSERAAATTIRNSQQLESTPSVSFGGFPFLSQLASKHFGQVTVRAHDLAAGTTARPLTIDSMTVVLHNVHVSSNLRTVHAKSAQASGTIGYASLSRALGITVSYGGQSGGVGRLQASGSVTVLGQPISGTVSAGVAVADNQLQFVDPQVDGISLPSAAVSVLRNLFGAPLALSHLPFGASVQGVQATPAGIAAELTGADLVYTQP